MGAYSNPQIIVDTQTGQHFRNLQESIAGSFANFAQSYTVKQKEIQKKLEENQKRLEEVNKETDEYSFALRTAVNKIETTDSKLDVAGTFEPLIQEAVKLKSGLLNNTITGQDRQKAMQKLADINSTISGNFSVSLGDISSYAEDVDEALRKPLGSPGGLAIDMAAEDVRALRIMQGKLGGTKKAVYKDGNPNNLVWEIYDDTGELVKEYSASKLKKIGDLGNEYIKLVPDQTANNESIKVNNNTVFETVPVNPKDPEAGSQATGRITDNFMEKDANGDIKTEKKYIGGKDSRMYKLVAKPDYKKIEAAIATQLDAQIAGLTDEELMLHTNNTVNEYRKTAGLEPIYFDSDGLLDNIEKEQAIAAYKDHFINTQIAKEQDILREDSNVLLQEDPKPTKAKATSGKTGQKDKKPTFAEVSKQIFDQQPGTVNDFTWGNKKVSFDGTNFFIATGENKYETFKTKQEVIDYLKTGKIK
jgi:hypothetical protein